jgi:hypothetical protein
MDRQSGKTKSIHYRKLPGLKSVAPRWHNLVNECGQPDLSYLLFLCDDGDRIHLCGPLDKMTRDWMREPLSKGWKFGREFAFKHRTAVYEKESSSGKKEVSVKLASHRESWFPGCEDAQTGCDAWRALESEWKSTGLPLLSSPAATGKALLWESLPRLVSGEYVEFPSLDDDLATLIRGNSPQHRIEVIQRYLIDMNAEPFTVDPADCVQYDGRWMYAAMCGLDRFPIGQPKRVGGFVEYQPGIYNVRIRIPETWNHVGLLPVKGRMADGTYVWGYPCAPGTAFITWAFEPELTLALKHGWEIMDVYDGYAFEKGRPLLNWSGKLIEMRAKFQEQEKTFTKGAPSGFAAAAVRQILNHTIGAMHRNDFEREMSVSDDNFRQWRRENPDLAESETRTPEKVPGGYLVPTFVKDTSRFAIFMPHWSATLYSLARARVAEWALRCDPSTLVKINGDAIYSTVAQPELDKLDTQRLGQPRRK